MIKTILMLACMLSQAISFAQASDDLTLEFRGQSGQTEQSGQSEQVKKASARKSSHKPHIKDALQEEVISPRVEVEKQRELSRNELGGDGEGRLKRSQSLNDQQQKTSNQEMQRRSQEIGR